MAATQQQADYAFRLIRLTQLWINCGGKGVGMKPR